MLYSVVTHSTINAFGDDVFTRYAWTQRMLRVDATHVARGRMHACARGATAPRVESRAPMIQSRETSERSVATSAVCIGCKGGSVF